MKKITCEMCGSTDLIKKDGIFECQSCGTKYSVEEAKKMMVEGTVNVQGTVKVDGSQKLDNLYQVARRAKDDNNSENASKYYDMILIEDPNSWEAAFYVVYFKAYSCKIAEITSAAISVNNCLDTVLKLIKDTIEDKEEQRKDVKEIADRTTKIATMLFYGAKNHYNDIDLSIRSNYINEYVNNCVSSVNILYTLGDQIEIIFGNDDKLMKTAVEAWKNGVELHVNISNIYDDLVNSYVEKIKKYDSEYIQPAVKTSSTGGCYVATAVYGSYDCPEVWTLRRFRDYKLAKTWYGRAFIKTYYAISPTIVKLFGETKWFKKLWRGKLDKLVNKLHNEGIKDTPYNDKEWK